MSITPSRAVVELEIAGVRVSFDAPLDERSRLERRYGAFVRSAEKTDHQGNHGTTSTDLRFCRDLRMLDLRIRTFLVERLLGEDGIVIHGAAVLRHGHALLFFGPSGSGKSTIAEHAGEDALSDELVIVRKIGDRFRAFGTPFWSGQRIEAPLEALCSLEHAPQNSVTHMGQLETLRVLLPQTAFPASPNESHAFALVTDLCKSVPGYRLRFRRACDFWPEMDAAIGLSGGSQGRGKSDGSELKPSAE